MALELTPTSRPLASSARVRPIHGERWLLSVDGVPAARVSRAVAELVVALDGRSVEEISRELQQPLIEVLSTLGRLDGLGVLDASASPRLRHVTVKPPMTIQISSRRLGRSIGRLGRIAAALSRPALGAVSLILLVCGAIAAGAVWPEIVLAVTSPVPVESVVPVAVLLVLATVVHEAAHGATLARFGQTPARAGLMVLVLAPAFFVDVTNGWYLQRAGQRVQVALAGPLVHGLLGAVALCVAALAYGIVQRTAALLGCLLVGIALFNLIPFVRFDGYLALMAGLDEPHLRQRSMRDAGAWIARGLLGASRSTPQINRWWSVPFGVASAVVPFVMTIVAFVRIASVATLLGAVGLLVVVALAALLAIVTLRGLIRVVRTLRTMGVGAGRLAGAAAVLVAATTLVCVSPVPVVKTAGYMLNGDDVLLTCPNATECRKIPAGTPVTLYGGGAVPVPIGEGIVGTRLPRLTSVPAAAMIPIDAPGVVLTAWAVPLSGASVRIDRRYPNGVAAIHTGVAPAAQVAGQWFGGLVAAAIPGWGNGARGLAHRQ